MPILPTALIVKELLIRQQFIRGITLASLAKLLRESLVALEWLRIERLTALTKELEVAFHDGINLCSMKRKKGISDDLLDLQTHLMLALPTSIEGFFFNQCHRWGSCHQSIPSQ